MQSFEPLANWWPVRAAEVCLVPGSRVVAIPDRLIGTLEALTDLSVIDWRGGIPYRGHGN